MKITKTLALGFAAAVAFASASAMASDAPKAWHKCKACHKIEAGKNGVGPSLHGVLGRKAGTAEGYKRYKAFKGVDFTWTPELLEEWIADQRAFLKAHKDMVASQHTAMNVKIKKKDERDAIVDYLKAHAN